MPRLMQAHEKRKNVMAYYQEKLNPVIEQLHEFYALIETKTPMAVLLTLKERFKHVEEDKIENETVEQAKFEEFIAFVEAFYRATLKGIMAYSCGKFGCVCLSNFRYRAVS